MWARQDESRGICRVVMHRPPGSSRPRNSVAFWSSRNTTDIVPKHCLTESPISPLWFKPVVVCLRCIEMDSNSPAYNEPQPSVFRWILGFLMVGACWGLTTPFMRKAAMNYTPPQRPSLSDPHNSWAKRKVLGIWYAVIGVLSRPAYAVPLLLNVTGSVWFFILIGKAELSLTVPITNSLAFLFTVLGEWWAEKKVISRDTWIGMAFVLGGIGLCVQSKT